MDQLTLFDEPIDPPSRQTKRLQREQTNYQNGRGSVWDPARIERYQLANGKHAHRIAGLMPIESKRFNSLEANIQPADYPAPEHDRQPLIVALGMGTDSVAMLVEMKRRGIRPDIVQWADTGSERIQTYRYVRVVQQWLKDNGFPPLLIVRRRCPKAGHRGLVEQLIATSQLPSPAFHRNHSCSVEWKLKPQRRYHEFLPWMQGKNKTAVGFSAEETNRRVNGVAEVIGFSSDESGRKSYAVQDEEGYTTFYPLREWEITRTRCVEIIAESGLPQPGKSSCFFCPMMKKCEIANLEPEEQAIAFAIEDGAEASGKMTKARGLKVGIQDKEKWSEWLQRADDEQDSKPFPGLVSELSVPYEEENARCAFTSN